MEDTTNGIEKLMRSRKFWVMVLDIFISTALFFGGKYLGAKVFEDVKFLIAAIQPVMLMVIGAITAEDRALIMHGRGYLTPRPPPLKGRGRKGAEEQRTEL